MDKWVVQNPKAAAYMLYLSAVIIILFIAFIYYYQQTKKHIAVLSVEVVEAKKRERLAEKRSESSGPKPLGPNEDPDFIEEDDNGFQILVDADE